MRSHGWAGNTPASDEEAIERILDAADSIINERGSAMRIADVARTLGVTRQTVYRYFSGTEALLVATAMRSADGFLGHLATHVSGITDPIVAIVEGVAFAIEQLASDNQVEFVLSQRGRSGIMSDTAVTSGARCCIATTWTGSNRVSTRRPLMNWRSSAFGCCTRSSPTRADRPAAAPSCDGT